MIQPWCIVKEYAQHGCLQFKQEVSQQSSSVWYLGLSLFCFFSTYFSFQQFMSIHDHCIRVIYNLVTDLLEYLAVFPEAYVDLILLVTILVEYLHLCNAKQAKLQFSDTHFPIFTNFSGILLFASYFSKKFAGKIGAALVVFHKAWVYA